MRPPGELGKTAEAYLQRLEILSDIDRAILQAETPRAVAEAALHRVSQLVACVRASVILFDVDAATATVLAAWVDRPTRIPAGTALSLDHVAQSQLWSGLEVVVEDLQAEGRAPSGFDDALAAEGIRAYLRVPLRTSYGTIGALNVSTSVPTRFDREERAIIRELADRLAVALTHARIKDEMRASHARLSVLSKRLIDMQESERQAIARELHDEIGQLLTGLKLGLGLIRKRVSGPVADDLRDSEALVDDLVARVRRLTLDLRPPVLDAMGLGSALAWHIERFAAQTGIHVTFTPRGITERFSTHAETAAYRVVQEALTNIARHARVDRCTVEVTAEGRRLRLVVDDRGCGFDPAAGTAQASAGLAGMAERVALLGGHFRVRSAPGQGTTVEADISTEG